MNTKNRIALFLGGLFLSIALFSGFRPDPSFFEIAKQLEIFTTLFKELNMNYVDEPNPSDLMNTAIKGMLEELDPYTTYLSEDEVAGFRINQAGSYSGVGASIRALPDRLKVIEVFKDYSADRAGLRAGDEIVEVDGVPVAEAQEGATTLLQGAANTTIELKVRRGKKTFSTEIERKDVTVNAVPYYGLVGDHTGYIVLTRFNGKASAQVKSALLDLRNQGATQYVLDLRSNPGGLLTEAINLVNLFTPRDELVVFTRSRIKKFNNQYKTQGDPVALDAPLAVLIDERSASASEIVSGGLQDMDRAVIVGKRSFGKGLVQRPIDLVYGTNLKVTISRYYTSSGRCIQALDYTRRDAEGRAVRKEVFNEFKTRNGRTVRDGGGIRPDIAVEDKEIHPLIVQMKEDLLLFDFCTDYLQSGGQALDVRNPSGADERLWSEFRKFLDQQDFSMETESEGLIRQAMSKDSLYMDPGLRSHYEDLIAGIEQSGDRLLEAHKEYILSELREELLLRQVYREGLYPLLLNEDPVVSEAVKVLDDNRRYRSILKM